MIESVKKCHGELQQMDSLTRKFCRFMREHDLFTDPKCRSVRAERSARSPAAPVPSG